MLDSGSHLRNPYQGEPCFSVMVPLRKHVTYIGLNSTMTVNNCVQCKDGMCE